MTDPYPVGYVFNAKGFVNISLGNHRTSHPPNPSKQNMNRDKVQEHANTNPDYNFFKFGSREAMLNFLILSFLLKYKIT